MSTKPPPPLFRPMEVLKICATPRAFKVVVVALGILVGIPTAGNILRPAPIPSGPSPLPVPQMDWTTDARAAHVPTILGILPSPGPNQIRRAESCEAPARIRRGGCWLAVADEKPPCDPPPGKPKRLWADDDRCWFPVAEAKPTPTSGGNFQANVAGEE